MKNYVELIVALQYKLRMFGFPIDRSTEIFCDNEEVYNNASTPKYQLRKKHHSMSQRGLVVLSEILRYFPCAGSQVRICNFESLRTFGRGDYNCSGLCAVANSHAAG